MKPNQVLLTFEERDADLLAGLAELAEEERRSLSAQILYMLDAAHALTLKGEGP